MANAANSENQQRIAALDFQNAVQSMEGGKPRDGKSSSLEGRQAFWRRRNQIFRQGDVFGIKTALGIQKSTAVNFIANLKIAHASSDSFNGTGPVRPKHDGKLQRKHFFHSTFAKLVVPHADSGSLNFDKDFARTGLGCWNLVYFQNFLAAVFIDGDGLHRFGLIHNFSFSLRCFETPFAINFPQENLRGKRRVCHTEPPLFVTMESLNRLFPKESKPVRSRTNQQIRTLTES